MLWSLVTFRLFWWKFAMLLRLSFYTTPSLSDELVQNFGVSVILNEESPQ
jgi:hypothetical protein